MQTEIAARSTTAPAYVPSHLRPWSRSERISNTVNCTIFFVALFTVGPLYGVLATAHRAFRGFRFAAAAGAAMVLHGAKLRGLARLFDDRRGD